MSSLANLTWLSLCRRRRVETVMRTDGSLQSLNTHSSAAKGEASILLLKEMSPETAIKFKLAFNENEKFIRSYRLVLVCRAEENAVFSARAMIPSQASHRGPSSIASPGDPCSWHPG